MPQKAAKIAADSDLRLNAWLRTAPPAAWSETEIVDRGRRLFEAATEIWPRPALEPENIDDDEVRGVAKGPWQFTDAALLKAKRERIMASVGKAFGAKFSAQSTSQHRTADGAVRAIVTISKRYTGKNQHPYWYAYHPFWHDFLTGGESGYLLLGCMDRSEAYAIPRDVIAPLLDALHTTTRATTGKLYWHVHLAERSGGLALLLPKTESFLSISEYAIPLVPDDASAPCDC